MLMSGFWVDDRQLIQESKGLTLQSVGHVIVITTTTNAAYRTMMMMPVMMIMTTT